MDIAKGVTVRVVRGKKVPIGTTGVVIWFGEGKYGPRVGIKPAAGGEAVWTDAKNVEVAGADAPAPQAVLPFGTDAQAQATLQARIAQLEARLEALEALAAAAAARRAAAQAAA